MESYVVSIACAVASILCIVYVGMLRRDFFHPTVFYVFCQCVTLGIAYLKFTPSMTDFKTTTWFVWIGGMIGFILGSVVFYLVSPGGVEITKEKLKESGDSYNWRRHFVLTLCLTAVFVVGAVLVSRAMGGLYLLTIGQKTLRTSEGASAFANVAFASAPFVVVMWMIGAFKTINPYKPLRIVSIILGIFVMLLALCVYPGRNALFLCLGSTFILFNYLKKKIPTKFIIMVILLAVSSFVAVGMVRSQYGDSTLEGMGMKYMMTLPYKYIANNFWNLDYAVNPPTDREIHPTTYGLDMAAAFVEYTGAPGSLRKSLGWDDMFNDRVTKEPGYNTLCYLWEVYKNWGVAGCVIFPFFVSFLMSFLYERMKVCCKPQMFVLMSISIYHVGWSFFTAGFKFGHVWLWVYTIILMHFLCKKIARTERPKLGELELAKD